MIRRLSALSGGGSLQRRLMLVVIAGALLFSAAAAGVAYALAERRTLIRSRDAIENLTTAIEKTLAIGAFAGDRVLLDEVVKGLAGHALVSSAEVRMPNGKLLVRSARPTAAAQQAGADIERPLMSPFDATERVGTLRMRIDMHRVAQLAFEDALRLGAVMVGQIALVALLLYGVVAWLVSRPIVRMARALPDMEPGSERRLETPAFHRDDEIGMLVGAANALLDAHGGALHRERALRAEIEEMEAQYRQIFDSSSAGIFVLDAEGRLINSNPTVSRVVGMSREQLVGLQRDNFVRRVFARPEKVERMVDDAARSSRTMAADLRLLQDGGVGRWVHCLISVQSGRETSGRTVEGVIYDVTERKVSERRIRHRAEHDVLTGLKNRAAMDAAIERMLHAALARGTPAALLCIDLDGFKQVNDQRGHQAGDQVLVTCAARMSAAVRSDVDTVGRVGGDEFVIALPGLAAGDEALHAIASALLVALRRPIVVDGGARATVGASIGVACFPRHGSGATTLLQAADRAMYDVKRTGKNAWAMAVDDPAPPGAGSAAGARGAVEERPLAFDPTDY